MQLELPVDWHRTNSFPVIQLIAYNHLTFLYFIQFDAI